MPKEAVNSAKEKLSYHHGNLRQALIKGAVKCIREHGSEHLSMRGLAREVGVSQSAPYRHFNDKNSLLTAIASQGFATLTERLQKVEVEYKDNPADALRLSGMAYVEFAVEHPETYRLMFGMRAENFCRDEMDTEASGCFQVLHTIIENGQKQGVFKPTPVETLALASWSLVHGYSSLIIDGVIERFQIDPQQPDDTLGLVLLKGIVA